MSLLILLLILYSIIFLISEVNHMKKRNVCNRVIASRDAEKVALCRKQFQNENNISDDIYNHAISVISNVLGIKIKEKLTPEDQIRNGDIYICQPLFSEGDIEFILSDLNIYEITDSEEINTIGDIIIAYNKAFSLNQVTFQR